MQNNKKTKTSKQKTRWMWWCIPLIPVILLQEAEARETPEIQGQPGLQSESRPA